MEKTNTVREPVAKQTACDLLSAECDLSNATFHLNEWVLKRTTGDVPRDVAIAVMLIRRAWDTVALVSSKCWRRHRRDEDEAEAISRFHSLLEARRRVSAAAVSLAESIRVDGKDLVLRFGIDRAAAREALEEPPVRKLLTEVAREAFGRSLRVVLKTGTCGVA